MKKHEIYIIQVQYSVFEGANLRLAARFYLRYRHGVHSLVPCIPSGEILRRTGRWRRAAVVSI